MAENKGKPSGNVAANKKEVGAKGTVKELGATTGAKKKKASRRSGEAGVTGTIRHREKANA